VNFFASRLFAAALALGLTAPHVLAAGNVEGLITDIRSGAPAEGVTLRLGNILGFVGFVPVKSIPVVQTGPDGVYRFTDIPNNNYIMRIEPAPPLLWKLWSDESCSFDGSCSVAGGDFDVIVRDGETFIANASIGTTGQIAGRVTRDADDGAVVGARVRARGVGSGLSSADTLTDANGDYVIDGLPYGNYIISASSDTNLIAEAFDDVPCIPDCNGLRPPGRTLVAVISDGVTEHIDLSLASGAAIAGVVREPQGAELAFDIGLSLRRWDGTRFEHVASAVVTPGVGAFSFAGLPAGTYVLSTDSRGNSRTHAHEAYDDQDCAEDDCSVNELDAGTPINLASGELLGPLQIELEPAASISGCVSDAITGMPIPDVLVIATTPPIIFGIQFTREVTTGPDGCYLFDYMRGSAGRSYRLRTQNGAGYVDEVHSNVSCWGGACNANAGIETLLLHDQDLDGIDFELESGPSISGSLREYAGGPPMSGVPIRILTAGGAPLGPNDPRTLQTQVDGSFRSYALLDGGYRLTADIISGPYRGSYVLGVPGRPGQTPPPSVSGSLITISDGTSVTDLEFVLTERDVFGDGFEQASTISDR
jgi:hypothetical protein